MERGYEFTGIEKVTPFGVTVRQIRATRDIPGLGVRVGDVGGWIESEKNLTGNAWVSGNARVYGDAQVSGNAQVSSARHCITVGPIGSEGVTATLFRVKGGGHTLNVGCWTGTLGDLMGEVEERRKNWGVNEAQAAVWVAQYRALRKLGKATVKQWKDED